VFALGFLVRFSATQTNTMAKSAKNTNLHSAKKEKNDEFYTQLADIENELKHYKQHFAGKTIFCNCDDPRESNFVKYFFDHFYTLRLKRLIATCYKNPSVDLFSTHTAEQSVWLDYTGEARTNDINPDRRKMKPKKFKGDGDFRNEECIELLKQSDIICTNPPFSLFREYVAQLVEYDKKFLIIGHQNAITYKEIFKLIKENKIWLGYGFTGGAAHFINIHYVDYATASNHKEGMIRVSGVHWFTNIETSKRHEKLELYKKYNPAEYPKYDNYNAIEISKTINIPLDYNGVMGVPITFLDKYNPEQFEIIKFRKGDDEKDLSINGKCPYFRILIQHKTDNDINKTKK
jgi:hypothetical protein